MSANFNVGSLFQGLSSGGGNLNYLSDYASIKSGSYAKLLKAYYGTGTSSSAASSSSSSSKSENILDKILEEKRNPKVSEDVQKANSELTAGFSSLKKSVSALQNDNTYTATKEGQSAEGKVTSAVKNFVSDYNNLVKSSKRSTMTSKTAYVANMMKSTAANADKLSEIGIKVNSDGTLQMNESKLKSAGISKVQELFSADNSMSYGSVLASRIQFSGVAGSTGASNTADSTQTDSTAASSAASLEADSRELASDALYEMVKDKQGRENYDVDKIFATAKSFVSNYNSMFEAAGSSKNSGVVSNLSYIREKTEKNAAALKQFGISVDGKGKMKIDEDTFRKSDMSKVQKFFKDYGSSIATNASLVDYYMTTQANAASGYTADGAYNVQGGSRYAGEV